MSKNPAKPYIISMPMKTNNTETLPLDTIAAVRRFSDGNLRKFWLTHLEHDLSLASFYNALAGYRTSTSHIKLITFAVINCDKQGEFLDAHNPALSELALFFRDWWAKYSEEVGDPSGRSKLVPRSSPFDGLRATLIALKLLDDHGFPTELMKRKDLK